MRYSIEQIKEKIAPIAKKHGIPAVYLFGSYARGTETDLSDLDLLIDTEGTALKSLFALGGLYSDLEEAFEIPIDMVTLDSLKPSHTLGPDSPEFRENVLREKVMVYAAA